MQGVTYRVQLVVDSERYEHTPIEESALKGESLRPVSFRQVTYFRDGDVDAPVYDRAQMKPGHVILGPAIIEEELCTTMVIRGQRAVMGSFGEIQITVA